MITFGLNADDVPAAAAGAAIAGVVVLGVGAVAHRPLASVPQNTIKFAVGLLLSTFGTFWAVEGLGVFAAGSESLAWPGGDAALHRPARGLVGVRVDGDPAAAARRRGAARGGARLTMRLIRGFLRFWYDFIVGDDWRIALGVVLVLAAGGVLVAADALADDAVVLLVGAGIVAVVSVSIVAGARR